MSDWKSIIDWSAFGSIAAAFFKLLPDISGLVGLVWLLIRVWETDTVRGWTGRVKEKKIGDE